MIATGNHKYFNSLREHHPLHKGGMSSEAGSWFHSMEHSKLITWREANSLPYGHPVKFLTPNS